MVMFAAVWQWDILLKWPVLLIILIMIGSRQHAIAVLGHDGSHYLITTNRTVNDFLSKTLCFLPFGSCLYQYRIFHSEHHKGVGTDNDPEYEHLHHPILGKQWSLPLRWGKFWSYIVLDFCGGAVPHLIKLIQLTGPKRGRDILENMLFFMVVIGTFVAVGLWWVVAVWFVALWATFWASFRVRIWTEHIGTQNTAQKTHRLQMPPWWLRFLCYPHNVWAHWEHHEYVSVPFYNLPRARMEKNVGGGPEEISIGELFKSYQRRSVPE